MPGGTGVICELGRTGSLESVGGLDKKIEIDKFLTQIPERSKDAWDDLELQGLYLEIDEDGKTVALERIRRKCEEVPHDRNSNDNGNN